MKKLILIFLLFFLLPFIAHAECVGPSFSAVQAAVTAANRGDTVEVCAGTATWSSRLEITKAIKLIGAGRGSGGTKIYFAYGTEGTDLCGDCPINYAGSGGWGSIKYKPTDPQSDENEDFVITGFDFNQDPSVYKVGGILILNCSVNYPLKRVQIYSNNFKWRTDSGGQQTALHLNFQGYVWGVVYDNVFEARHPYFYMGGGNSMDATLTATGPYPGNGCTWPLGKHYWENMTAKTGTDQQMVFEDNTLHYRDMWGSHFGGAGLGGTGYTVRYNNMYFYDDDRTYQNGWQLHGAYYSQYGASNLEVYGNYFYGTSTMSDYAQSVIFCRSGRCMAWGNLFAAAGNQSAPFVSIGHECMESLSTNVRTTHTCYGGTKYDGYRNCTSDGQPQHPYRSYFWKNFYGATGSTLSTTYSVWHGPGGTEDQCAPDDSDPSVYSLYFGTNPTPDIDFWKHDPSNCYYTSAADNKCTTGMGCGATLPTSCKAGTGFWRTDESCTQLTRDKAGASDGTDHTTREQLGVLYRCATTNNWQPYYTPLKYPHPFRAITPPVEPCSTYNCKLGIDSDVVALYKFESGALTTDSKESETLTNVNSATASATHVEGSYSTALASASEQSYKRDFADLSSYFPGKPWTTNKIISIAGWFRATSLPSSGNSMIITALSNSNNDDWNHGVLIKNTGGNTNLKFILGTYYIAQSQEYTHATNLSTDTWYHFTVSFDGTSAYAIRLRDSDGNAIGTDITGTYDGNSDTAISFAADSMYFNGLIDELVYFKRVLTSEDAGNIASGDYTEVTPTDPDPVIPTEPCAGYSSCRRPIIEIACEEADETVDILIGLRTNKNATCKWDISVDGTPEYNELTNTYDGTGTQEHTDTITGVSCNGTTRVYYACKGENDVESDVEYSDFTIADYSDSDPVVITGANISQAWNVTNKIFVSTDKPGRCYWCVNSETCTTSADIDNMTEMTYKEGDINHFAILSQEEDTTTTYNIKCKSTQGVASSALQINLTTKPAMGLNMTGSMGMQLGTGKLGVNFK